MKIKSDQWQVTSDKRRCPARGGAFAAHHPSPVTRHSEKGMALVITLILLAVTLVMALAFLAISRRESSSVTTAGETATARLAADAALANAEAQAMANILSTTNPYDFGLLVSTNYINPAGFVSGVANPTNVNYYDSSGNFLTGNNFLQNLENLYYSPRPPVFIQTNANPNDPLDFRFYLDLNRNGTNDANGDQPVIGPNGGFIHPDGTENNNPVNVVTNFQTGDPEWIGVLEHPDQPYGPNNPIIARYAFIALPVGNGLDLNAIHNQTLTRNLSVPDGFFRNQGVGSWEINLAAFLADLNTNEWANYNYNEPLSPNAGISFDDARALLAYRYNNNYNSLATADNLFQNAANVFPYDGIDGYSDGPLQTTFDTNEDFFVNNDNPALPWAGADNTNRFFTPSDLFDPTKSSGGTTGGFTNRLLDADTGVSTYDRYTFYRLLSQLGTDSSPESGKMNLNYDNLDRYGNVIPGAETNFIAWATEPNGALRFFTSAADRMLRAYTTRWFQGSSLDYYTTVTGSVTNLFYLAPSNYLATYYGIHANYLSYTNSQGYRIWNAPNGLGLINLLGIPNVLGLTSDRVPAFGITSIPVYVDGQFVYTPAVNRILQLAANIYDATVNNSVNGSPDYPDVFRPLFGKDLVGDVYITGYTNLNYDGVPNTVSGPRDSQLSTPFTVEQISALRIAVVPSDDNIYGVPWIIGAKKGFPNFNEFSMLALAGVERKLEITRPAIDAPLSGYQTNQMYILSISNSLGVECWNSYATNFVPQSGNLTIVAQDNISMVLTNLESGGASMSPIGFFNYSLDNTVNLTTWPSQTFDLPLMTNVVLLTNSIYVYQSHSFTPANDNAVINYLDHGTPPLPQFGLLITNRLQVFMLDGNHVIDYVQFAGPDTNINLNAQLDSYPVPYGDTGFWNTNAVDGTLNGTPYGVWNQIYYSLNPQQNSGLPNAADNSTWRNPPGGGTVGQQIASFDAFFSPDNTATATDPNTQVQYTATNTDLAVQVPFTPVRYIYGYTSWQANDPLVHYLASDLNFSGTEPGGLQSGWHQWNNIGLTNSLPANNLGKVNDRYAPWGLKYPIPAGVFADTSPNNLAYKDPLVRSSDNWDFPANKFPAVGWLGRVHRGTPWQTVFLKSTNIWQWVQTGLGQGIPPGTGTATWEYWTGDLNPFDAFNDVPVQDWLLFDLFTTAFNDNATRGTLSVNVGANNSGNPAAGLAASSALFSGVTVLSNNLNNLAVTIPTRYQNPLPGLASPSYSFTIIQPAGTLGAISPLGQLVAGINQTRARFTNADGLVGAFEHVGDILAVPQLSDASPFLDTTSDLEGARVVSGSHTNQLVNGISDEMYEWLPQQVMSLLRVGTPRYVIYSYGQTLKPAPNGIVTSGGNYFGMVTNYQVVAETATRAVVRFDSTVTNIAGTLTVTNNRAVIESYNILPPD
jgi:hypothetical protein